MDLGRKFLAGLGIGGGNSTMALPGGRVGGPQAIEYVIARGAAQRGVPYSWGGGARQRAQRGCGPGRRQGRLRLLGLHPLRLSPAWGCCCPSTPATSTTPAGTSRHPQAKRGDLIFYGPGGTQHVTIYLGNGQMMEASSAAGQVTVSPVRTAGMTPYLTRIIET